MLGFDETIKNTAIYIRTMHPTRFTGTEPNKINWDNLADSIADGEAVLVLGPDAIPLYRIHTDKDAAQPSEQTFSQLTRSKILQAPGIEINFYYERDGLFLFKGQKDKNDARKIIRETARDTCWLPDEELLRQITAIPFPVILNLSPEEIVYQSFIRHFKEPQFDFCTPYNKDSIKPLTAPSHHNPLIYNLCGNVLEKLDSPILDYFDLFQLFTKLLGNDEQIPQDLKHKLRDADKYILLGFQLDRWYFQLFVHYLNWLDKSAYTNINQNYPILSELNGDCREFVLNQFNITHIAPSRTDFDELYAACARKQILRPLHNPYSPVETQVRALTVQNKFEAAFHLLERYFGGEEQPLDLLMLRGRYAAWQQDKQHKTADDRDLAAEINKIRYTLLTFAGQLGAKK